MFFRKKKSTSSSAPEGSKDIDIHWGGYYVVKQDGMYQLFRLLDFYQTAYHVQPYAETFDHVPMQAEITLLKPQSQYATRETKELLAHDLVLINAAPLTIDDVAGYNEHLETNGYEQAEIDTINERVLLLSKAAPTKVRLSPAENGVTLTALDGSAA